LKKSGKFHLSPAAQQAIETLKTAFVTAPVVNHPDFSRRFYMQCDASDTGVGAVLFQLDDQGNERPIESFSQKLNKCQKNYSVTEKECLAAILGVKRFRPYVESMPFTIITDHASLKWLMSLKDLDGRLAHWSLKLQIYDFVIEHRKGSENVVADILSRMIESIDLELFLGFETQNSSLQSTLSLGRRYWHMKNVSQISLWMEIMCFCGLNEMIINPN